MRQSNNITDLRRAFGRNSKPTYINYAINLRAGLYDEGEDNHFEDEIKFTELGIEATHELAKDADFQFSVDYDISFEFGPEVTKRSMTKEQYKKVSHDYRHFYWNMDREYDSLERSTR